MTNAPGSEETEGAVKMPGGHHHGSAGQGQDSIPAQLRRRRLAALRCEPLGDGRQDPWSCRTEDAPSTDLDSWARALLHLERVGLTGLPPAPVRRALAEQPERYAAVLPRRTAA
jgi:hypothetical protein